MKSSLSLLLIVFFPFTISAQPLDSLDQKKNRIYVGLGLSTNYYEFHYKNRSAEPTHSNNLIARPYVNFGYRFTKRISLQMGVAYANKKVHYYDTYFGGGGNNINYHFYNNTRGVVVPFTLRFVFFNANKKLPLYGTASIIPAYAQTVVKRTEETGNLINTTFYGQASGMNTFFTAGLGFTYRIKKRFSGYAEVLLINRNMTGDNIDPFRFEKFNISRYIGFGFNYNF